ncbi:MAG: hypothetical protein Q9M25_04915 [Mariprofundaceae bacterium]|nr:hypothetical protein [Mariprofundaceae bacterium]
MLRLTTLRLKIAHLNVEIDCSAKACAAGIGALTQLFKRSTGKITADLSFAITGHDDGITLCADGEKLWQSDDAGEVVAAFEWAFYNRTIAALYPQFLSLHASTFAIGDDCITCAGKSGSGKSSLCTVALLHGASYFTDEYTLLDRQGNITAFPRPLQWGGTTHPAFAQQTMSVSGLFSHGRYTFTDRNGAHVESLLWHAKHVAKKSVPMTLLLLPRFDTAAEGVQIEPLPRSQALLELAAEMHHQLPTQQRIHELNRRMPKDLRYLRVVFSDVHQAWQQIESLIGKT